MEMQVVERNSGFLECLKQKNEKNNKVEVCQAVPTRMLKAPLLILWSALSPFYNVNVRHLMTISVRSCKIRGLQYWGSKNKASL